MTIAGQRTSRLRRTYDRMRSWGFLDETPAPLNLVNANVQQHGYAGGQAAVVQ